jgi:hypothetical protein
MTHYKVGWKTNLKVRPEADWNDMVGRAVNKN